MSTTDTKSSKNAETPAPAPESGATPRLPAGPRQPERKRKVWTVLGVLLGLLVLGGAGGWYWWQQHLNALPPWIAMANGRLEAEQVEIATKFPGRITAVLAKEGDMVAAGTVVARMDTVELEAQLHSAEAMVDRAKHEKMMAEAQIAKSQSERIFAGQELLRTTELVAKGWSTPELLDQRRSQMKSAEASYDTATSARDAADATITAGQAEVARLRSQINDSTLVAPAGGRIQYKLAQPGEVLQSGGRVLTLLDLDDVYMTIFVPAYVAGVLGIGDEARVTLDPVAGYVFPAHVTFVATEAQFTPKTVETAEEREKLMFRVKLTINPELKSRYESQVKTGVRGIGYVRTDKNAVWPGSLNVKLP